MWRITVLTLLSLCFSIFCSCQVEPEKEIKTGAEQTEEYLPLLNGKSIGIVANHTSLIDDVHLVDTLIKRGIRVKKIFSPEHGFRGDKDAGELINNNVDEKTGLPVISLYGSSKKPSAGALQGIDLMVFDIQDVGVRFYTYISTMHYVMEACAENNIPLLVLDRPNPNGFYMDGPVLDTQYRSFVGLHPIPLVHGMTVAELARMINREGWLKNQVQCDLKWISCENYTHDMLYELEVKPSPNLPNMRSVYLYPSLGLFEGTMVNVGRGTDFPFQVFGHPKMEGQFSYKPRSIKGASKSPKHKGEKCFGTDLREYPLDSLFLQPGINLDWLLQAFESLDQPDDFFLPFFTNLVGTKSVEKKILNGESAKSIRAGWKEELGTFNKKRKKYLLYEDF